MDFVLKLDYIYGRSDTFKANLERPKTKTFSTNPALLSEPISYSFHHNHFCSSKGVGSKSFLGRSLQYSLAVFHQRSIGYVLPTGWACSKRFLHMRVYALLTVRWSWVCGQILRSVDFVVDFGRFWLFRLCSCLCWSHCLRGGLVDSSDIYVEVWCLRRCLKNWMGWGSELSNL